MDEKECTVGGQTNMWNWVIAAILKSLREQGLTNRGIIDLSKSDGLGGLYILSGLEVK